MLAAPIVLFAYNRLEHIRRTIDALLANEFAAESELYVFCDGSRSETDAPKVDAVQAYVRGVRGFKSVTIKCESHNRGLSKSIIRGVTAICQLRGRAIVMEDDLVTSPRFLRYMNEALDLYENDPEVISIHGYIYPVQEPLPETFFLRGADCWGWATWQRGWAMFEPDGKRLLAELESRNLADEFDFNGNMEFTAMLRQQVAGENDSWAIRWYASAFLRNKLTLYPGRSLVQNIGVDGSGRHCGATESYTTTLSQAPIRLSTLPSVENLQAKRAIENFLRRLVERPSILERITLRLWRNGLRVLSNAARRSLRPT